LDDKSLSKLVQTLPSVLGLSIEENLEPKLVWLQERLSLDDKSLSKLVQRLPAVLGLSIEDNLEPKLSWLQERLELDCKSLCSVIQLLPSLLGMGIETNIDPTIEFYEDCVGSNAAIQMIAKNPRILGSSLEKRLKPRLAQVQEAVIPLDTATITRMAQYTEKQWSIGLAYQKTKLLKQQLQDR
jgi:hypothetical protein